jgi:hypothetical protein
VHHTVRVLPSNASDCCDDDCDDNPDAIDDVDDTGDSDAFDVLSTGVR